MVNAPGAMRLGCLGWILLVAAVLYVGSSLARPYYRFYRFRDAIVQNMSYAQAGTDSAIQNAIWATADSLHLPEGAYDVHVLRAPDGLHVTGGYDDSWTIANRSHAVHFDINMRGGS